MILCIGVSKGAMRKVPPNREPMEIFFKVFNITQRIYTKSNLRLILLFNLVFLSLDPKIKSS